MLLRALAIAGPVALSAVTADVCARGASHGSTHCGSKGGHVGSTHSTELHSRAFNRSWVPRSRKVRPDPRANWKSHGGLRLVPQRGYKQLVGVEACQAADPRTIRPVLLVVCRMTELRRCRRSSICGIVHEEPQCYEGQSGQG